MPRRCAPLSLELLAAARPEDGAVDLLVAPMVRGVREFIAGLVRDPQFGPCVMFGVGGVLAEALGDVAFRLVPLTERDAAELLDDLATQKLLGPFRGEPAVDRCRDRGHADRPVRDSPKRDPIAAVDLNPLIVVDGKPVAVDALVELSETSPPAPASAETVRMPTACARCSNRAVSSSPVPRRTRASSASSRCTTSSRRATPAGRGRRTSKRPRCSASDRPHRRRPSRRSVGPRLRLYTGRGERRSPAGVCAPGSARRFLTSAGYGEAGPDGVRAQRELVALADELGILLAGPNGQGVVSTPADLCAQIVAPYPPAGRIGIASQSGNFVSSFENWSVQTGVGVSRAVSAGNAAALSVADYLDWYADDDATAVSLAYVEGVEDGRALFDRLASVVRRKPVVLVRGGTTASGQRAAASHTGSLAADDRIFDGMCRQAGVTRAATIEEAFEAAATFATQPLPRGPRTAVLTTAGGWGVVTADAIARRARLELAALPDDLRAAIDEKLPPRWSRNNPIDFAGGETRDTIPEVMELVANHSDIDAIVYLGLGIQSNSASSCAKARSIPSTDSSASSPITSGRTCGSRRRRRGSPTRPASRS